MRAMHDRWWLVAAVLALLLLLALPAVPPANSQQGGQYDLSWNTIDGGGTTLMQGGNYSLGSTVGAADAAALSGGQYTLAGGFWSGVSTQSMVYVPVVQR